MKLEVFEDTERGDLIRGDRAALEALSEAIATVLEKRGQLTVGLNAGERHVFVELIAESATGESRQ